MTEEMLKQFEDSLTRVKPSREWALAMIAEVRRLREALETAECQLDCWLDLPTGTRRAALLQVVRDALGLAMDEDPS